MTTYDESALIRHLRGLADGTVKPFDKQKGLCFELYNKFDIEWIYDIINLNYWPEFSGSEAFPIPCPRRNPHGAYTSHSGPAKWGPGPYGQARRRLCAWVADQLEAEL